MGSGTIRRVSVLGAGGMGTALALALVEAGCPVRIWARDADRAAEMTQRRRNVRHLPGVPFPDALAVTADPAEACLGSDLLVAAIPSAYSRTTMTSIAGVVPQGVPVLSVVKGIEFGTFARPSQVLTQTLGPRPVSIMGGPCHAEELALGKPASVVIAGADDELNRDLQALLTRGQLRVYTNNDAIGVELAGALKNVLGLAAGICDGLDFGDNAKAALLTRGLAEIARFGLNRFTIEQDMHQRPPDRSHPTRCSGRPFQP